MKRVARFEKVSFEQYIKDTGYTPDDFMKSLWEDIKLPIRKTAGSAGYDFLAPYTIHIAPHETVLIETGIKCYIKEGYVLELFPRSSLGFNYKLTMDNTVGIIDSDYYNNENNEGHIKCKMTNNSDKELIIKKHEGYMQGIFKEFFITEDDNATDKRVGGIGSTSNLMNLLI